MPFENCPACNDESKIERESCPICGFNESRGLLDLLPMTTLSSVTGHKTVKDLGIVTAECVFGMNVFRDFFAGMTDVFGGRSAATQKVLRDTRETCLRELSVEAKRLGATAVLGVKLDYSEISGKGKSMLFLVASGTAVLTEPLDE